MMDRFHVSLSTDQPEDNLWVMTTTREKSEQEWCYFFGYDLTQGGASCPTLSFIGCAVNTLVAHLVSIH